MVPADSHRISPVPCYSGSSLLIYYLHVQGFHLLWQAFPEPFHFIINKMSQVLQPRIFENIRFGLFRFRSPLLAESLLFSLPPGTEMFQFPRFALWTNP